MAGNTCGHIRCEAGPCQWHRPPALEAMASGAARVAVRAQYRDMMLAAMDGDQQWCLDLARLTRLDANR